ncbi:MAG: helix-turn-helix transcriptional regulator, partial [Armatimonadetes bacterium]|nr:helix-turn-helix transcriptional regulator [Armatimonadota bacterium]
AAFVLGDNAVTGSVESAAYPEALTRAMAFIASRLEDAPAEALPLSAIADVACVSPEHLCRLFTAHTYHTPAETVRLLRLDRAALLLVRTNFSVGEIASLCGFASPFHFSRRFKEAFGQTASDLRREVMEGRGTVPLTRLLRIAPR